ncbi:hypothetical protein RB195_024898 [Necator americanus]|uniref:Uncharacterized protein n=1 Tax=Necator americanus TaxID=51031 RepID=A0ABR1EQ33_NECAM
MFEAMKKLIKTAGVLSLLNVGYRTTFNPPNSRKSINCDDAFHTLAAAMREKVTSSNMHCDESNEHEEFNSAFHVDGVLGNNKKPFPRFTCCSSMPEPMFV